MNWVREFYEKQNAWSGCYEGDPGAEHYRKAALISDLAGAGSLRVLELGAGGGQVAAAAADLGHSVVAVELRPTACTHARQLAATRATTSMVVIEGDFYAVSPEGLFDVVCYWDGFGIGSDDDQRRLLSRIAGWLKPDGSALIEVGTPWYAAAVDGRSWEVGVAERQYSFDADGCRWQDTWWPKGDPEKSVQQSTRCYSPADLRLLADGTGLKVTDVKPGGTMDWVEGKWLSTAPLKQAMSYVAQLKPQS